MTITWSGIFHIMATPFTGDGALDSDGLPHLVESALATGVDGVTILGIAGEAHRLTDDERVRVVDGVVKSVAGRVPVVWACPPRAPTSPSPSRAPRVSAAPTPSWWPRRRA